MFLTRLALPVSEIAHNVDRSYSLPKMLRQKEARWDRQGGLATWVRWEASSVGNAQRGSRGHSDIRGRHHSPEANGGSPLRHES